MPRYEVGLRTQVRFAHPAEDSASLLGRHPETVGIKFEGRLFVWHANQPGLGGEEHGPTLTVVAADEEDYRHAVPEAAERFLSALAFHVGWPIERAHYGGSAQRDPFQRATVRVSPSAFGFGWYMTEPPAALVVEDDPALRLALAVYREALNASSPFYGFLAFWNTLDAVFDGDEGRRDTFINGYGKRLGGFWPAEVPWPADLAASLRESSRNAIAHVIRDPGRPMIDPDLPGDRRRLGDEARFLRTLAREAIRHRWPDGVRSARAGDGTTGAQVAAS